MDWERVLWAGIAGAVIGTLVSILRKNNKAGAVTGGVIMAAGVFIWNVYDAYRADTVSSTAAQVSPDLRQYSEDDFNYTMEKLPVMALLKELEPALWEDVRQQMLQMRKEGKTEQQMIDMLQPQVLALQLKALQRAPDRDVVEYMRVNMEQTAAAQRSSDDDCFRFLFPMVKGGINPMRIMPAEMQKRMETDLVMLRNAYGPEQHQVTEEERRRGAELGGQIGRQLQAVYGADLQVMTDPYKGIGKEKLTCDIVQDLWSRVLALPEKDAAIAIRTILE